MQTMAMTKQARIAAILLLALMGALCISSVAAEAQVYKVDLKKKAVTEDTLRAAKLIEPLFLQSFLLLFTLQLACATCNAFPLLALLLI